MRNFIALLSALFLLSCKPISTKTDKEIRASVVKLYDPKKGSCSGTQVEAPSGKKYILTAAHCIDLANDGVMAVETEDSGSYFSKVIEEDGDSDLLLLEGVPDGIPAVKIANDIHRFTELTSFTHGHGYPTYSTEGAFVGEDTIQFIQYQIDGEKDKARCNKKKNKLDQINFFGIIQIDVCTVSVVESVTTVPAVPGSSGGLVTNSDGELVGVVSTGGMGFTNLVTLKDIHHFLEKR